MLNRRERTPPVAGGEYSIYGGFLVSVCVLLPCVAGEVALV